MHLRYRSGKPLIVTTNLTLDDLRNPEDTALPGFMTACFPMCVPVRFTGDNFPAGSRTAENGEHEETDYRLKGVLPMTENKQHDTRTTRRPTV